MDAIIEEIASRQHGLITARQARDAGFTEKGVRHRVRTGRWRRIHPGTYALVGAEPTPELRVHAVVIAAGPDAVASHTTAAAVLGLPGFGLAVPPMHITVPAYTERLRTAATIHRTLRLPTHHVRTVGGIPCTAPARTLFDLCGLISSARAERAIDNALARRLVTVAELGRVRDELAARGRAGSRSFGRFVHDRAADYVPPESELEARFVALVRDSGLPEPDRQVDLGDVDVADLEAEGVEFTAPITDQGFGRVTTMVVPGGAELDLYEPRHATAYVL